jgi:hypothetical protein
MLLTHREGFANRRIVVATLAVAMLLQSPCFCENLFLVAFLCLIRLD